MKLRNILSALLVVWLLVGCYEDKGNYNYDWVNEISVTGINKNYIIKKGHVLEITPKLHFTRDDAGAADENNYEYLWIAASEYNAKRSDTIARTRDLHAPIDLPKNSYLVQYVVRDIKQDLNWRQTFKLDVTLSIAEGWIIGEDVNGKMDIGIYARMDETTMEYNGKLLSTSGIPEAWLEGPRGAFFTERTNLQRGYGIWFFTDHYTGFLNPDEGHVWTENQCINNYVIEPQSGNYTLKGMNRASNTNLFAFTDEGDIKHSKCHSIMYNMLYGPDLCTYNGENFKVAPYVVGYDVPAPMFAGVFLFYDVANKRFMQLKTADYTWVKCPDTYPHGMDLKYMQMLKMQVPYSNFILMQDGDKIYQSMMSVMFYMGIMAVTPLQELKNAPHLAGAEFFAYHQTKQQLYYANGQQLYVYRNGKEDPVQIFRKDEQGVESPVTLTGRITALQTKYFANTHMPENAYLIPYLNYIVIASEGTDGTGEVLILDPPHLEDLNVLEVKHHITTEGKVISIDYQTPFTK